MVENAKSNSAPDHDRLAKLLFQEARFEDWAKKCYWTVQEFAALTTGLEPWAILYLTEKLNIRLHPAAITYFDNLEYIRRAVELGKLPSKISPDLAVNFCQAFDLSFPKTLSDWVGLYHPQPDWKVWCFHLRDRCEDQAKKVEQLTHEISQLEHTSKGPILENNKLNEHAIKLLTDAVTENTKLKLENAALKESANSKELEFDRSLSAANDNDDEGLNPKKRTSYQKMIAAMGVGGYKYDPKDKKSHVPKEVADDAAKLGLSISSETVKAHLDTSIEASGAVLPEKD